MAAQSSRYSFWILSVVVSLIYSPTGFAKLIMKIGAHQSFSTSDRFFGAGNLSQTRDANNYFPLQIFKSPTANRAAPTADVIGYSVYPPNGRQATADANSSASGSLQVADAHFDDLMLGSEVYATCPSGMNCTAYFQGRLLPGLGAHGTVTQVGVGTLSAMMGNTMILDSYQLGAGGVLVAPTGCSDSSFDDVFNSFHTTITDNNEHTWSGGFLGAVGTHYVRSYIKYIASGADKAHCDITQVVITNSGMSLSATASAYSF